MAATRDSLLELVALAYEAALEPNLWPEVAACANRAFESPHVMLGVADGRGNMAIRAEPPGWGKVDLSPFQTVETNPGLAFSALTPPSTVALRDRVISDSELELAALRALAPHLNRALRVTMRLREMEAQASALAETGDRALTGLLLTDAYGRVAQANGLARAILEETDGLIIHDGALRAARSDDNARLVRLILEAAGGVDGLTFIRKSGVMQVARPSCRRSLALVVSPTCNAAGQFGRSHAVCVSFADPERGPEVDADLLARLYGFTAREAAVAALLVRGRSPNEAADELAMTQNTVRTHIRHALEKTGADRLADLVRLLMKGPGVRGR
jgi:DNA-binding CsgD family transcriptional regulator